MPRSWVASLPNFLPRLLLSILAGLQQVSGGCQVFLCPEGFECCGESCCVKTEHFSGPMRTFVISFLVIIPLLCICGLSKRLCRACVVSESEPSSSQREVPIAVSFSNHSRPSDIPAPAPFGLPPPYSEVIQKPVPCPPPPREPPPPYSPTPIVTTQSTHGGIVNPAF
ncbi:transmembrane protein 92-like [Monodelphis domestica]|uniref:Transmembrane protein 92 n=1 Tax=Monodelphis domestica TaxID=13616 RepID=F7G2U8_MONDO|nr:transmembrane protein 92 [Monodelphis domestica]XP_056672887.1 transmembrane protein 92-like [Monodelphis domestica]